MAALDVTAPFATRTGGDIPSHLSQHAYRQEGENKGHGWYENGYDAG